jgi:hypothetical protein
MPRKSIASEITSTLEKLPNLTSEEFGAALERLEELGVDLPVTDPVRRPGITCPVTQVSLVTTCNLSGCSYSIENEWSRNCLLDYLNTQGSETLAVEEIAFLYQVTPGQVESTISSGITNLQSKSLETLGFRG